jgi:two-component system sensor histidine kinase MprB
MARVRTHSIPEVLHRMPLRARVSILIMAVVGLTIAIASTVSYAVIRNQITERLDADLFQRASLAAHTTLADPSQLVSYSDLTRTLVLAGLKETIVTGTGGKFEPRPAQQRTLDGQITTLDASAPADQPEFAVAAGTAMQSARTVTMGHGTYRAVAVQIQPGFALVLAESMAPTEATLHMLGIVSTLVGLAGIAVAGAVGFSIGRAALRPVERLTVATEYIARTGDLRRLAVTGDDELARLTNSFNTMLVALARSQDYQRRLVADAGHELRTPLTSMRTNLDLLAQAMAEPDNPRLSAEDRVDLMNDVRAQMGELSLLISDLVELSRDEHPAQAKEQIDFGEVVDRAVQRVQRRASSLTYDVRLDPWYLEGDPAALERAVMNLLDNAAKWSPPGGTVTVSLHGGALQVADEGPGIADEDMEHVFERFYRSPEARTLPGSGLGLAIVHQVAENHGGRVAAARASGGGALLGVWLPGVGKLPEPDPVGQLPTPSGPAIAAPTAPNP